MTGCWTTKLEQKCAIPERAQRSPTFVKSKTGWKYWSWKLFLLLSDESDQSRSRTTIQCNQHLSQYSLLPARFRACSSCFQEYKQTMRMRHRVIEHSKFTLSHDAWNALINVPRKANRSPQPLLHDPRAKWRSPDFLAALANDVGLLWGVTILVVTSPNQAHFWFTSLFFFVYELDS